MENNLSNLLLVGVVIAGALIAFNAMQISAVTGAIAALEEGGLDPLDFARGSADLSAVDVSAVSSTPMAIATVMPELKGVKDQSDAINTMVPTGTPEYSDALGGISFDEPVLSMQYLSQWYLSLDQEVKQDPVLYRRYLDLAAAPRGISCEFCCGVGPQGIDENGRSRCGCQHHPALLALTLGLMKNTDYSDAQILREVMRWKTLFFPQAMVGIGLSVAGKDPSTLQDLPGMVGGC